MSTEEIIAVLANATVDVATGPVGWAIGIVTLDLVKIYYLGVMIPANEEVLKGLSGISTIVSICTLQSELRVMMIP